MKIKSYNKFETKEYRFLKERSNIFNNDIVKKIDSEDFIKIINYRGIDDNFNINSIEKELVSLGAKNIDIQKGKAKLIRTDSEYYKISKGTYFKIEFDIKLEDTYWSEGEPWMLKDIPSWRISVDISFELELFPLSDEYYIIKYLEYKKNDIVLRVPKSGCLLIDGSENLIPTINNMFKNFDIL